MKILVLSYYYPPSTRPSGLRSQAIVKQLAAKLPHAQIDVLATGRYADYHHNNIAIKFVSVSNTANVIAQAYNFTRYFFAVMWYAKNQHYDLIYASSGRLMTGFLAALIKPIVKAKLYLDIRDLFTDNLRDMFSKPVYYSTIRLFKWLEKFTLNSADIVNLVSPGFVDHIKHIAPSTFYTCHTNGIYDAFILPAQLDNKKVELAQDSKLLLYAGNIGYGQALHKIIPKLATVIGSDWQIKIIGEGNAKNLLVKSTQSYNNVVIQSAVARKELINLYQQADVLFLHLDRLPCFETVIPSKIFEYAASAKPIIAAVTGYASEFISKNVTNAYVCSPCDAGKIVTALSSIKLINTPRQDFCNQYKYTRITAKIVYDMLELLE